MNLVSILIAPVVIQPLPETVRALWAGIALLALAFSIFWSKRGGIVESIRTEAGEAVAVVEAPAARSSAG